MLKNGRLYRIALSLAFFARLIPTSGRSRLLWAFTFVCAFSLVLAAVGWKGLTNTQQAIRTFDEDVLPDIARSLELAERSSYLAALAPYVAEATIPFQLQTETAVLRSKTREVLLLAQNLPLLKASTPELRNMLHKLEKTLTLLTNETRQELFLREDIRQHLFRLNKFRAYYSNQSPSLRQLAQSISNIFLASVTATGENVNDLRLQYQMLSTKLKKTAPSPHAIQEILYSLGSNNNNIFELRQRQLVLVERKAYLLASTRAISVQLGKEINHFVSLLQDRVNRQSNTVYATVRSGQTGIGLIAIFCLLAAGLGMTLVFRLTRSLGAVTELMTRLAQGDTSQAVPATNRGDEVGDLARAFNVFRENAVARKTLTADLNEQTNLLKAVFANIHDGLSVFDNQFRLFTYNPQFLEILEIPGNQICRGMSLEQVRSLLPPCREESLHFHSTNHNLLFSFKNLNTPQTFELHFENGKVVEVRSRPMPDGGVVRLYSDLTERRTAEAQLRQSQKMEVLGQLTGGVAHDFNNLLAATIGNLELLLDQELADSQKRYARRALAASERGANLTRRLLAFASKQQLTPEWVQVDELIQEMIDLAEYSVGNRIRVELDLNAPQTWVHVDGTQLENSLLNLAINSSSAMPQGGTLRFSTRSVSYSRQMKAPQVIIEVIDTGCGIPEYQLERVFEPFFSTKSPGEGSGLGLSIVYGFVKQSGGKIEIDSQIQVGTTIRIILPTDSPPTLAINSGAKSKEDYLENNSCKTLTPTTTQNQVLLVEDDAEVRETVSELLQTLEFQVITANSVISALDYLTINSSIHLVISDIHLGKGGNGIQLKKQIAKLFPSLHIILTSGLPREQLITQHDLETDTIVLRKPFRKEDLENVLRVNYQKEAPQAKHIT